MANIKVDLNKVIGRIKPLHAVGQGPISGSGKEMFKNFHYLTEMGAPYSRLHDVAGRSVRTDLLIFPIFSEILMLMKTIPNPMILHLPTP